MSIHWMQGILHMSKKKKKVADYVIYYYVKMPIVI